MILRLIISLLLFLQITNAETIEIPVMVGLTGASAHFGKLELDAYRLAVEEWNEKGGVNGKKVILKIEDTQTNQREVITAFQRLAYSKPVVILGPTWLDSFEGVLPLAKRKNILLVTPSAALETLKKHNHNWPITFYHNSSIETKALVDLLEKKGFKNIALFYEQEPFAEMIRELLLKNKINLKADIGVQSGEVDFRVMFSKLKKKDIDSVLILIWNEKSLHAFLKQLAIRLPKVTIASIHDAQGWLKNPTFSMYLKKIIFTKFDIESSDFKMKFEKRYSYKPYLTSSNAYDAINSVLLALSKNLRTAAEIKSFILTNTFNTATFGKFKFNSNGSVPSKVSFEFHQ